MLDEGQGQGKGQERQGQVRQPVAAAALEKGDVKGKKGDSPKGGQQQQQQQQWPHKAQPVCWMCGKPGHFAKNCPHPAVNELQTKPASSGASETSEKEIAHTTAVQLLTLK